VSCAQVVHKTVKGKYKTAHKKVVSNFSKERMGQIDFLNPPENCRLLSRCPKSLFFRNFPSDEDNPYEIFMNRSGLPDGHFAMLMPQWDRFVSPGAMILIVLAAICLLACVFFLFVLFQWTRDPKRKTTTRTAVDDAAGETCEKKRPRIVASRETSEKHDRFSGRSRWVRSRSSQSGGCGPGCNECERTAYEKVARSFRTGKRI